MTQLRMDHPQSWLRPVHFIVISIFARYSILRSLSSVGKTGLASAHTADCGEGVRGGYELAERMPIRSQISATGTLSKNQYIVKRGQIWPHRLSKRSE